jgi:hypothetical protein
LTAGAQLLLQELVFPPPVGDAENSKHFPEFSVGSELLQRTDLINRCMSEVLDDSNDEHVSQYWRAPAGGGKTVFLKLLGAALQKHEKPCKVYYIASANILKNKDLDPPLNRLVKAARSEGKRPVLLIDEVHNGLGANWTQILRGEHRADLIILGVGIPALYHESPNFRRHHLPAELMFNAAERTADFEELVSTFCRLYNGVPRLDVAATCKRVIAYTGGQMYPLLKTCDHLFQDVERWQQPSLYLASEKFSKSEAIQTIRERCFHTLLSSSLQAMLRLLTGVGESSDAYDMKRLGWWNPDTQKALSSLVVTEVLNNVVPSNDQVLVSVKGLTESEKIRTIIEVGLQGMTIADFDLQFNGAKKHEDALSFCWARSFKERMPSLWFNFQQQSSSNARARLDFLFNGATSVAIEVAKDNDLSGVSKHFERYSSDYVEWKGFHAVLNLVLTQSSIPHVPTTEDNKGRVYQFHYPTNALFCGDQRISGDDGAVIALPAPVQQNVGSGRQLPRPQSAQFSTLCSTGPGFGTSRTMSSFPPLQPLCRRPYSTWSRLLPPPTVRLLRFLR